MNMGTTEFRVCVIHRGEYVHGETYQPLDEVSFGNPVSTYRCVSPCIGIEPTNVGALKWVLVSQGLKGDTGATGAQGPKGDTGATGAQGIGITNILFDAFSGKITIVTG